MSPSKLIVLIVEDNSAAQFVLKQLLAKFDYDAHAVSSGEEAIEATKTTDYACILMDISLPGMDGYETSRKIKSLNSGHDIPIVAITGHAGANYQKNAQDAGIVDVLIKPFNSEDLRHILLRRIYNPDNINLKVLTPSQPISAGIV